MKAYAPLLTYSLLLCLLGGCGPGREPPGIVKGRITNQKRPVSQAVVYFEKVDGDYTVFAPLDSEGVYQIKTHDYGGLPAGKYRIRLKPAPESMTALVGDVERKEPAHPLIPSRYQDVATSGLTAEVRAGENPPFDFDLGKTP